MLKENSPRNINFNGKGGIIEQLKNSFNFSIYSITYMQPVGG